MNILRLLLSLLVTQIIFADAELELAKKYFTEAEIEESLMWEFKLAYGTNGGNYPSYKTEPMKFYKSKELTGEVFAEIDDKGLKIEDQYVCNYEPYSDEYVVLAQKFILNKHKDIADGRYTDREVLACCRQLNSDNLKCKNSQLGSNVLT